ncbi:MAG: PAS domain-containing protein [bacterium]|nr:PAS domain-containing protein [bacterium]
MAPEPERADALLMLLDGMDEATALLGVDGTVLMANAECARRLGRPRDQVIGRDLCDLLPPDAAALRRRLIQECALSGSPVGFTDASSGRWLEHRIVPLRGADGVKVDRFAVYSTDVTERRESERERAAWNAELETIHANSPMAVVVLDAERRIVQANRVAAKMAGLTPAEACGRVGGAGIGCLNSLHDPRGCGFGPTCDRCELRLALVSVFEQGVTVEGLPVVLPAATPDGPTARHLLVSAAPISLAGARHVLVSLQDITRLRRAEEDIAFKAMALDQIQDRVTATDLEGRIIYVNNATCRSLKARREDLVGHPVETALGDDPSEGATQAEIVARTLEEGHWDGVVVNRVRDGSRSILHCRTSVMHNGRGVPIGMCGIATDITEAKRREARLVESERCFRRLHEQLPLGYFGLDRDGCYVDANPAWQKLVGLGAAELEGRPFTDRLAAGQAERFELARQQVSAGAQEQVEIELHTAGGQLVTVFCAGRGSPGDQDAAEVSHWLAADVSERRRLESQLRQAQKLDALGRLAAGVAYDFNNQLTVIAGYCDLLLEATPQDSPLRAAMEQIRRASARASATTCQLLAFSRKHELAPREVDLNAAVSELLHPLGKLLGEATHVRTELSPRLRPVRVDPGALQQAVFNLVINARDAMGSGGSLVLRTANGPAADGTGLGCVSLTVEDSGQGIAPEDLEHVFEPFFTTKGEGRGTGLGLSMVQGFAEQSGGTVGIRSQPGVGTAVTLTLPATTSSADAGVDPEAHDVECRLDGRFLVVEDSEEVRDLVSSVLRRRSAEVHVASSASEALEIAAAVGPFDVLLTDLVMPGMHGGELAARLLAAGRLGSIVYMSGYHDLQADTPAGRLLAKPFKVSELVVAVQQALGESSSCVPTVPGGSA